MYEKTGYCGALLFLGYLAKHDIKLKRIPAAGVIMFGLISAVYFVAGKQLNAGKMFLCILPGIVLLILAFMTREKIGYGDGVTVLVLGLFLGEVYCMAVLCLGIMLTGIYSFFRVLKKNKEPVPLIPFLLAALEVVLIYA